MLSPRQYAWRVAVKLHRCGLLWFKLQVHPCWRVQSALDEAGIAYEIVKEPLGRGKRTATIEKTGQQSYPWLELEDGTVVREESAALAARIRAGSLLAEPVPPA